MQATFSIALSPDREKVERFESELKKQEQTKVDVQHHVHGGMYARTGLIPAGTSFVGAIHKKDHINVVCGDVTVLTDEGTTRYVGYSILPASAGSKRVAYANADTMWTTILKTNLTDISDIEDESVENAFNLQTRAPALKG